MSHSKMALLYVLTAKRGDKEDMTEVNKQLIGLINLVINEAYK